MEWDSLHLTSVLVSSSTIRYGARASLSIPNVKLDTTERTGFSQYSIHTLPKIQQKILRKETQCTFQLECVCVCVSFGNFFCVLFWWMCQQVYGVVNNFGSSLCPCIWHAPIVACQKEFQFEGYKDNFNLIYVFSFFNISSHDQGPTTLWVVLKIHMISIRSFLNKSKEGKTTR